MRWPRWKASWLMLSVAGAIAFAVTLFIAATPIEQIHRLMVFAIGRDRLDEYTIFDRSVRYRNEPASANTYRVAFVGGSTVRESIWSEEYAEHVLNYWMRGPVEVLDLSSGRQYNISSWALAEYAACRESADVVVLGVSVGRSSQEPIHLEPHIAFDAAPPHLVAFMLARGYSVKTAATFPISAALRFRAYAIYMSVSQLLRDFITTGAVGLHANKILDLEKWHVLRDPPGRKELLRRLRDARDRHAKSPPETYARNWDIWDGTVRAIKACGAKPVLFQTPVNPLMLVRGPYAEAHQRHVVQTQEFAARNGVPVIDATQMGFRPPDFFDYAHLGNVQSIQRATEAIAQRLSEIVTHEGLQPRSREQ